MPSPFEIGRKPDYVLSAKSKRSEETSRVGVAWVNKNGSVTIKLNAFVVLRSSKDLLLTLFSNEKAGD